MAKKLTDKQVFMIKSELQDGMSSKASIAKRYGVSVGHINDIEIGARRENVKIEPKKTKYPKLEEFRISMEECSLKITDQDVRDIRKALQLGETPSLLAKKYNVSARYITDVGNKKRRNNVV